MAYSVRNTGGSAMWFEPAFQTAIDLGKGTIDDRIGKVTHRDIDGAKWRLLARPLGRLPDAACRRLPPDRGKRIRETEGVGALRQRFHPMVACFEENRAAPVNHGTRR